MKRKKKENDCVMREREREKENKSFKIKRGFSLTSNMNYGVQ